MTIDELECYMILINTETTNIFKSGMPDNPSEDGFMGYVVQSAVDLVFKTHDDIKYIIEENAKDGYPGINNLKLVRYDGDQFEITTDWNERYQRACEHFDVCPDTTFFQDTV